MSKAIKKLLIANRGEIACRIIRTAKRLGIPTVAVYSEADANALHVRQADEAVPIGASASADSYLNIDRLLAAVGDTGADAVHPGFGFLSENADFAKRLAEADIRFIGPGIRAIEIMGDKIASKKLAESAGVNTVPGHTESLVGTDEAVSIAEHIGYPVMLKASAGGGGKGMRVARTADEVRDGFTAAQNEARTAFGDDRIFVEKFIEQPRHIEIQLIADAQGNCVYLAERECSIQRRHQKVIEEAPSSFISEETRRAMGEQAVALARAVDYQSAGTVEFIVDAQQQFYFLEMNTRLQVEHPVTECITGVDLVELMIMVASGLTLPMQQSDVRINGWSFEARVYAEDPDRGFLPSTGRITHYEKPSTEPSKTGAYTRVDTGVDAGGEISVYYDPMIAKLITWAPTRAQAIEHMQAAIESYRIDGIKSNLSFLSALFAHPALHSGDLTTGFIEQHFPQGFNSREFVSKDLATLPCVAAWLEMTRRARDSHEHSPAVFYKPVHSSEQAAGPLVELPEEETLCVFEGEHRTDITLESLKAIHSGWSPGDWFFEGRHGDSTLRVGVKYQDGYWNLSQGGTVRQYRVLDPHVAVLMPYMPERVELDLSKFLLSPMPGLLTRLLVSEGDAVVAGQELAIVEAMKMENTLAAEKNAVVSRIVASVGENLAVDEVIMEFTES